MDKIRNLSLRKTIVLYMIVSLIVSFYLSALIMRMAATIQDDIWWKYVCLLYTSDAADEL